MSGWILAVDFGTVNTGAAIRFADGRVEKVKLDPNSDTMPSAVVLTEGRWRVGQAALNARRTHPDTFIGSPKARLGQEPLVLGDDLVSPATIASHVLTAVRERAVRAAGGSEPDRLVLTHPVRWGRARLTALQEAAQIAGFAPDRIRLLPEPIAALHAHVPPGSLPPGSRVAVVDTGGGTCDVAILQTTDDTAPGKDLLVVAQEGDDRLGGNDLDDLLYQWVLTQLQASGHQDLATALADPEHLGAALTLLDVVRAAKQDLSEHTNAPVAVAVAGHETTLTITREEYEDLIAEPMTRAGALTTRAMQASGTTTLTGLYLTGGTAYTPALAQTLHKATGILTSPLGDPKLAVAVGALKTPVAVMTPTQLAALAHQLAQQRPTAQPQSPQTPQPPQARQVTSGPPRATPAPVRPPAQPPASVRPGGSGPGGAPPTASPRPDQTIAHTSTAPSRTPAATPAAGPVYAPAPSPSTPAARPTTPGYAPTAGPSTPSYAHGPGYPIPQPTPPAQPTRSAPAGPTRPGNGPKIAVGVLAGLLVLAVIGLGTWWFALRDDAKPEAGQTPGAEETTDTTEETTGTDEPCWDGATTADCPAVDGTAAAVYAFSPVDKSDAEKCKTQTTAYPLSGWTDITSCHIASVGGSATISQWPTVKDATTAFENAGYQENQRWTNADDDKMGPQWLLETGTDRYAAGYCYDAVPFCIEFSGSEDDIVAMLQVFHALSTDEAQALADYIDSH